MRKNLPLSKIFLISRPFLDDTSGTGEQYVANIFYHTLSKKYDVKRVEEAFFIKPYHSFLSFLFYDYIYTFIILCQCIFTRTKIVLCISPYQCFYIRLFPIFHIQTVVMIHDCFFLEDATSIFNKYSLSLYRKASFYADRIITSTEENKTEIQKYFSRTADVVPLYLDQTFDISYHEKGYAPRFGYIGKYEDYRKRVFHIKEFLDKTSHPIAYTFAGHMSQDFAQALSTIKNPLISYHSLGAVEFLDKIHFYHDIRFLFFPTRLEGFGLPLLEAMRTMVIPIVFEDARLPSSLKDHCTQIKKVEDIDILLEVFKKNKEHYYSTIHKNYLYSRLFNEDQLLIFSDNLWNASL